MVLVPRDKNGIPQVVRIAPAARDQIIEFRNTFMSKEGKNTWVFLHKFLGTFSSEPPVDDEDRARRAVGMKLLEFAGINHEVNEYDLHEALWRVQPVFETVENIVNERRDHG